MMDLQTDGRRRVVIEGLSQEVDGGRFPAKRTVGDVVRVEADIFGDGHDSVAARVLYRHENSKEWTWAQMLLFDNDRWFGEFNVTELGRYRFKFEAWVDHFETWRHDLVKRIAAETDTDVDYQIGAALIEATAAEVTDKKDAAWLTMRAALLRTGKNLAARRQAGEDEALYGLMVKYPHRPYVTESDRELVIVVDPVQARFSAWYELFPRSTASEAGRHGTFKDCEARLPYIAEMGFDVVYFPPIHPIGVQFRKGKNNSTEAKAGDVGSPWAIGGAAGGHKDIFAELGTIEDFRGFVKASKELGISVALDIAFQVSPDHPYVKWHEDWFLKRPDGTIQYAENPPKKYQDIYPFNFETADWRALWEELKSVFDYWIAQGVTIFRVDNPHTKAFPFWEWAIAEIKKTDPETLFLAEAFTRPKVMYRLAKLGFSQSYTYFPWRDDKEGITKYITELAKTPVREFFRPNQWPNTPDILTAYLQIGGPAVFQIRLLLVATLGANYGIYGPAFELMESKPVREGSEEYLNSEKYEVRHWDLERKDSLRPLIAKVNKIRKENEALQSDWTVEFHPVDNERLICYSKQSVDKSDVIVVVVNLDPRTTQWGFVTLPLESLAIAADRPYTVEDLLTGARYEWNGPRNYVSLNPQDLPGHVLRIVRDDEEED
jgi:starch synthase (maltosyl-transferring)